MNEDQKKVLVPAAAGVVGFVAGSVSTLFYVRHRMRKELAYFDEVVGAYEDAEADEYTEDDSDYEDIVAVPEEDVPRLFLREDDDYVTNPRRDPSEIVVGEPMSFEEAQGEPDGFDEMVEALEQEPSVYNIFEASNENWDWDAETAARTTIHPYILHQEEYFNDEKGYNQTTLTYYEGDDTLVDADDAPIQNIKTCLGRSNLRWGHGAADSNSVYIRNDRFKAEYEVLRDPGMYSVEVLGNDVEDAYAESDLKHSKHANLRFAEE